jgi:Protein of unknown function (DUF3455)
MKTCIGIFVLASTIVVPQRAHAESRNRPVPPPVPAAIQVPAGYKPYLAAHAIGTQGYVCVAVGSVYSWAPFGPQATLFNGEGEQILTHFLSPTPYSLLPNPTWQHSRDSSIVWGQIIGSSSDLNFVAGGAIPWLLLEAAVVGDGPTGGDRLLATRFIQRLNTVDGVAPSTGCAGPGDIKKRALMPYEADYFFYKEKALNEPRED